jgi:hypothetical protein
MLKKNRPSAVQDLEKALYEWILKIDKNADITDALLIERAKMIASDDRISVPDNFQFSKGWLANFKKRFNISCVVLHGESGSVDTAVLEEKMPQIIQKCQEYNIADIYNFDETALFWRMRPSKTLAASLKSKGSKGNNNGKKKDKSRISIGLCVNADGSDFLKPLVIGTAKNPRSFKSFRPNTLVEYYYNTKAWMNSNVFQNYVMKLDRKFAQMNRKILLVLDNVSSHCLGEVTLKNIELLFLPPNTTSKIQPLDQGIINSFKSKYRKKFLAWRIDQLEKGDDRKLPLKEAIYWIAEAKEDVNQAVVKNCWKHAGILGKRLEAQQGQQNNIALQEVSDLQEAEAVERTDYEELSSMLRKCVESDPDMKDNDIMTVQEFIEFDNEEASHESIEISDCIQSVVDFRSLPLEEEEDADDADDDDDIESFDPPVSLKDALNAHKTLFNFMNQQNSHYFDESDVQLMIYLKKKAERCKDLLFQPSITKYFQPMNITN